MDVMSFTLPSRQICLGQFFNYKLPGDVAYMDSRETAPIFSIKAHEGGTRGISQSFHVKGLLSTCGADEVKFENLSCMIQKMVPES